MWRIVFMRLLVAGLLSSAYMLPEKRATFSHIKSGNYNIVNCGSNQDQIVSLLQTLWSTLLPAIKDAKLKNASPAFMTFFSDVAYAPYVATLLTNVTTGVAIGQTGSPVFFCTTGRGQMAYQDTSTGQSGDVYTRCMQNPGVMMEITFGNPYIIVCPQFFTVQLPALPPPNTCPKLNKFKTKFQGNGAALLAYRTWILLEEIAHYYIYMTTKSETDIWGIETCARLNGKDSSQNAHNYLLYVASIYGGCRNFPTPPQTRPNPSDGRELVSLPETGTGVFQVNTINGTRYAFNGSGTVNT